MSTTLKTCPFCGQDPKTVSSLAMGVYRVQCGGCDAEGGRRSDEAAAALAWNLRWTPYERLVKEHTS